MRGRRRRRAAGRGRRACRRSAPRSTGRSSSVVDLTVRAAIEGRPEHVRHALMVDPNTAATLSVEQIWTLADAMVAAHAATCCRTPCAQRPCTRARRAASSLELGHVGVASASESVTMSLDGSDLADPREAAPTDLARVGDHDDPLAARTRARLVCASTSWCVVRPADGADPVDADDRDVEVDVAQRQLGERADQLVGLAARTAAAHDQFDVRAHGEFGGDVERVGDDPQPGARRERPRDLGRGRAAVEADRRDVGGRPARRRTSAIARLAS